MFTCPYCGILLYTSGMVIIECGCPGSVQARIEEKARNRAFVKQQEAFKAEERLKRSKFGRKNGK